MVVVESDSLRMVKQCCFKLNKMDKSQKILLSNALDILYSLEDRTNYDNKNIGEAINLLQLELEKK